MASISKLDCVLKSLVFPRIKYIEIKGNMFFENEGRK
jgi:hypothetical protein